MINAISPAMSVPGAAPAGSHIATRPASAERQDSVQLSAQAKALASGDADHDGDSH